MKGICFLRMEADYIRQGDFFDNNPFLLYNVDIISDLDLSALYRLSY